MDVGGVEFDFIISNLGMSVLNYRQSFLQGAITFLDQSPECLFICKR